MKKELPKIIIIFLITIGLVVWALNYIFLGSAPKSKATGETIAYTFDPASISKSSGDFTTSVKIKPSVDMTIRGYQFEINFDKNKVLFKSIEYKLGDISAGLGDDDSKKTVINKNGKIKVVGEIQTATGKVISAGQNTNAVTIVFTAKSSQSSSITTGLTDAKVFMIKTDFSLFDVPSTGVVNFSVNGGGGTGTGTPTPTVTPGGPTLTPKPGCGTICQSPGSPKCPNGLICYQPPMPTCAPGKVCIQVMPSKICRNPSCPTKTNCVCGTVTPTPTKKLTPTPTPTGGVNATVKLILKFQGITGRPAENLNKLKVKVKLYDENTEKYIDSDSVNFNSNDNGTWSSETPISFDGVFPTHRYVLLVKGPYHIQKKVCDEKPTETADGTYSCIKGNISLKKGYNDVFDLTGIILLVGDLPDQNGAVDAYDVSLVRNNLGKTDETSVANSDVNRDGIVDTQDYSLIIAALSIKQDEE